MISDPMPFPLSHYVNEDPRLIALGVQHALELSTVYELTPGVRYQTGPRFVEVTEDEL